MNYRKVSVPVLGVKQHLKQKLPSTFSLTLLTLQIQIEIISILLLPLSNSPHSFFPSKFDVDFFHLNSQILIL